MIQILFFVQTVIRWVFLVQETLLSLILFWRWNKKNIFSLKWHIVEIITKHNAIIKHTLMHCEYERLSWECENKDQMMNKSATKETYHSSQLIFSSCIIGIFPTKTSTIFQYVYWLHIIHNKNVVLSIVYQKVLRFREWKYVTTGNVFININVHDWVWIKFCFRKKELIRLQKKNIS